MSALNWFRLLLPLFFWSEVSVMLIQYQDHHRAQDMLVALVSQSPS